MKEQVKEWIADKNLTTDSFDSIMIGVIYNSYHNMLDDPDVRKWIGMNPSEFREMLPPNLNENQQIAINNSKKTFEKGADLYDCAIDMVLYDGLTDKEWAEATLAFLSWAREQEEE